MKISHTLRFPAPGIASWLIRLSVFTAPLLPGWSQVAAQVNMSGPVIYRLNGASTFQRGCFAPCLCPVMQTASERGTFVLTFTGFDGLFRHYRVEDVNWKVTLPSGELRVNGSGTYKVGGEFAVQDQLELDLKVGDNPIEHYDSGLEAGGGAFPAIKVTISVHRQVCFDTVFGVDAAPVPPEEIRPYRLLQGSTFQSGCFGICACAEGPLLPLWGSFYLVPVEQNPLFTEFSVAQVRWRVAQDPATGASAPLPVTGFGSYWVGGEFAVEQQMGLDLIIGAQAPASFDSGRAPGGGSFPRIDLRVTHEEKNCVRTVLDLHATPARLGHTASPSTAEPSP